MIRLEQTCGACPEQYTAFDKDDNPVGYLRLRHGHFRVECPPGETVYEAEPKGDGCFEGDEREYYLGMAIAHIELALMAVKYDDVVASVFVVHRTARNLNWPVAAFGTRELAEAYVEGLQLQLSGSSGENFAIVELPVQHG